MEAYLIVIKSLNPLTFQNPAKRINFPAELRWSSRNSYPFQVPLTLLLTEFFHKRPSQLATSHSKSAYFLSPFSSPPTKYYWNLNTYRRRKRFSKQKLSTTLLVYHSPTLATVLQHLVRQEIFQDYSCQLG